MGDNGFNGFEGTESLNRSSGSNFEYNNFKDGDLSTKLFGNNTKVTGNIPNQEQLTERGLISDVEYNLEETIKKLGIVEYDLNRLYGRIFNMGGIYVEDLKDKTQAPIVKLSADCNIRDSFKEVDNRLNSINKIIEVLNKYL